MTTKKPLEKKEEIETEEEILNENLDNGGVLQRYKTAAQVANETLAVLLSELKVEKSVLSLCELGDKTITEKAKPFFKKNKKMPKGIAFPTCLSVNEVVCHCSPLSDDTTTLKQGDVVRIDLGVHFDGYIATVAHTVVLTDKAIDGKQADVMACAKACMEVTGQLLIEGNTNTKLSEAFDKVASSYGVSLCEGVLSHQLKRFVIDGSKAILLKTTTEHQTQEQTFQDFEVYSVDILVTSGSGKLRETQPKTTIYKRNPEVDYHVKLKSSAKALSEIREKYDILPFSIRYLDKDSKLGLNELTKHGLIEGYPVLTEKKGEFVCHLKSTFFILKNETIKGTGVNLQEFKTDKKVDQEFIESVQEISKKRKNEKKEKSEKKPKLEQMDETK